MWWQRVSVHSQGLTACFSGPPVPYDNRHMYGVKYLEQLVQNVGKAGLLDVLFTWPLRNQFTVEMILITQRPLLHVLAFQVFNITIQSPTLEFCIKLKQNSLQGIYLYNYTLTDYKNHAQF